jgi:hypothetical protein
LTKYFKLTKKLNQRTDYIAGMSGKEKVKVGESCFGLPIQDPASGFLHALGGEQTL